MIFTRCALIATLLASSLPSHAQTQADGSMSTSGVPNPAAVLCVKNGGVYSNSGMCSLDGASIDGWSLWRANAGIEQSQAVARFFRNPAGTPSPLPGSASMMPNPAAQYCETVAGGSYDLNVSDCVFSDHSQISAWTLLLGPDAPSNLKLRNLLMSSPMPY